MAIAPLPELYTRECSPESRGFPAAIRSLLAKRERARRRRGQGRLRGLETRPGKARNGKGEQDIGIPEREGPADGGPKRGIVNDIPDGEGPKENCGTGP